MTLGAGVMANYLLALLFFGLAGPVWGEEALGADGFPANWNAEDFKIGEGAAREEVSSSSKKEISPRTFRVDELRKVRMAPSGTTPIALPPVMQVTNTYDVSKTYYRPLGAAFEGEVGVGGPVKTGLKVSETQNASDSKVLVADGEDVAGFGVLVAEKGGLAKNIWVTSSYAKSWLEPAPAAGRAGPGRQFLPVSDPVLREAWRRLLLTQADPPAVEKGRDAKGRSWLAVRALMLERLGMHEAAWSLWRVAPSELRAADEEVAQGWVRATLLAGESREPCVLARSKASARAGGWWSVAVATCAALEATQGGNAHALGLSLQLIPADQGRVHAPLMAALTAVRDGGVVSATQVNAAGAWDGLAGAVVAAYPSIISASEVGLLPDMALRRLRDSAVLPDALRIPAARALASRTAWLPDGEGLVRLVSQGVIGETTPDAAVLAWARREQAGREPGTEEKRAAEAALVVRAALRLGDGALAQAWWPRWRGAENLPAAARNARLQAQIGLEALQGRVSETTLSRWLAVQELGTSAGALRAQRLLLAVEGLQGQISDTVWLDYRSHAVKVGDGADAVWQRVLAKAAAAGDVPQVLALMGEGFGGRAVAEVPPGVAGASVAALEKVGLRDLAVRMLAEIATADSSPAGREPGAVPGVRVSASEVLAREKGALTVKAPVPPQVAPVDMLPPPRVKVKK